MSVFNQYSFLLLSVAALVGLALVLVLRRPGVNGWLAGGALVLGLALAYALLRPSAEPGSAAAAEEVIGGGTPVLLEFQSPY